MSGIAPDTDSTPTLNDFLVPDEGEGEVDEQQQVDDAPEDAAPPQEEAPEDAEDAEDEDLIAEEDLDEGEEDDGEEEDSAAPMPTSWSKEDAKVWAEMTPEQQAVVNRRESERDKFVRAKAFEASQTRQEVEGQARELIAQLQESHAQALQVYLQQFSAQEPDQRLLYTGNPDDVLVYQRQDAAYRAAHAQQQQLQQEIAQAQQQASALRDQAQQADLASDAQRLKEQLPEWFDPSEGPKLQETLQSIGSELGYPVELMAQASSTDIIALKKAADWKADAEKYRALMAKKMEGVRAAKQLPKMTRPGTKPTRGQRQAATSERRNQALDSFGQTRSGEAAAALLLERKR